MGQFSMEISGCAGSALSGNQQLIVNDEEVDKVGGFHIDEAKEMVWKELGKRKVPDLGF